MATPPLPTDRLLHVEELLAHQQRLLDELNCTVTEQRLELDALQLDNRKLKHSLARVLEFHEGAVDSPDERPPHY